MAAQDGSNGVLDVLDPVAVVAAKTVTPAPRLPNLEGRKIGLYWNTKPGGNIGLEEAAKLLGEKYENISFEKFYYRYPVGKAVLEQVKKSGCDAIIGSTAD